MKIYAFFLLHDRPITVHATKDSLFLCCMSKILKLLSIMSVLVFVKLVFISLVTIVSLSRVARNFQPSNLKLSHLSKPTLLKILDKFQKVEQFSFFQLFFLLKFVYYIPVSFTMSWRNTGKKPDPLTLFLLCWKLMRPA